MLKLKYIYNKKSCVAIGYSALAALYRWVKCSDTALKCNVKLLGWNSAES